MDSQPEPENTAQEQAAAALDILGSLKQGNVTSVIVAGLKNRQLNEVAQLQPTNKAAARLTDVARETIERYSEAEAIGYQPAGMAADGQVMWMAMADVPLLETLSKHSDDLANLPQFSPSEAALGTLRVVAQRVTRDEFSATLVQSVGTNQVVARTTRVGVILRSGILDVPDGQVVMLNSSTTALVTGAFAFFKDRKAFQQLTGLLEELRQQARNTLDTVTAQLRIQGIDDLRRASTDSPAMLGKMASIQRKLDAYPQYREALTMPKLVAFVRGHPECGVEIDGTEGLEELVFHKDPQRRFRILKLLDDDFLKSELTTFEYEANSKGSPIKT